ncbi:non-ribosomal peptide synthetase [Nonomuraea sp. NPDC004297]
MSRPVGSRAKGQLFSIDFSRNHRVVRLRNEYRGSPPDFRSVRRNTTAIDSSGAVRARSAFWRKFPAGRTSKDADPVRPGQNFEQWIAMLNSRGRTSGDKVSALTETFDERGFRRIVTSSIQDELWFLQKLVPESPAHNVCRAYRVRGGLDVAALGRAWRATVRRHEILRTTLVEADGLPVQQIAADWDEERSFTDLGPVRDLPLPLERLAATPFDLGAGPLTRLFSAEAGPDEHVVLILAHEAVLDEQSMDQLVEELSDAYGGGGSGTPVRYADFAQWQRDQASTPDFNRLLDQWLATLRPLPGSLSPAADRSRPDGPSFLGGAAPYDWGDDVTAALTALSWAEGVPPFVILLAAFQTLLHRHSGEARVAVGVPVGLRPAGMFTDLVGSFRNTLVLCADFTGRPTFRELLGRVARTAEGAYERREVPFDRLVRALKIDRDPRRTPLCDAMFVYRDSARAELRLPGLAVTPLPVRSGAVTADLTLSVDAVFPSVAGTLSYRSSLFEPGTGVRILEQLRTLLTAALREPGLRVDALPLDDLRGIGAAVRAADLTSVLPATRSAPRLVHEAAARGPESAALSWDGTGVSYRELEQRAARVTAALRAGGEVEGLPVVVRMASGPGLATALLGVLDAGAHVVCLPTGDTGERARSMLAGLRPARLLLDGDPAGDDLAGWYARELDGLVLDMTAATGTAGTAPEPPAPQDRSRTTEPEEQARTTAPEAAVCAAGLAERAYVTYTSGSTGRPKGIVQTHGALAQFTTWLAAETRLGPGARLAQWAAPGYDAGLVEIFAALTSGATLCPVPDRIRANPEKLARWLAEERITHFQTVPSFARRLLEAVTGLGLADELTGLGHVLLAGEALPGELAGRLRATLPGVRLLNLYGATETILATWHEVTGDGSAEGTVPIGTSIPGRHVLVLDDLDRPCPAGVTGHIVVRSPYVALGYIDAGAEAGQVFRPVRGLELFGVPGGRFYHTGDLGRLRWDGLLEFRGRVDGQIKFNGSRLDLAEVEAELSAHESVAECAVVAAAGPDHLVRRLLAYVVPHPMRGFSADELRAGLRRRFGKGVPPVSIRTVPTAARAWAGGPTASSAAGGWAAGSPVPGLAGGSREGMTMFGASASTAGVLRPVSVRTITTAAPAPRSSSATPTASSTTSATASRGDPGGS